ncbi:CubicO group peptidase (beta-lactamase class C family) [Oxalobacteraceae bacterium GrIS 2.11]
MTLLPRCFVFLISACAACTSPASSAQSVTPADLPVGAAIIATINDSQPETTLLHGVYVQQHGKMLAERYFKSDDKKIGAIFAHEVDFNADTLNDTRSVSKSVIGLLIGIALEQGKIKSLDTPVVDLLKNISDQTRDQAKRKITLRHLLTMSSGLKWDEDGSVSIFSNETVMEFSTDMVRYVLERPVAEAPGRHYVYNSGGVVLLGAVLETATGMPLDQYASQVLFAPLGIDNWEWQTSLISHQKMAHAGLRLTPRDLAKIGQLILNRGSWNGRKIVPAEYIQDSITKHLDAEIESGWGYGYLWRTGTSSVDGREWAWIAAMGNGGQRIFIVPALDLVVAITAGRYNQAGIENGLPSHQLFRKIVSDVAHISRQ